MAGMIGGQNRLFSLIPCFGWVGTQAPILNRMTLKKEESGAPLLDPFSKFQLMTSFNINSLVALSPILTNVKVGSKLDLLWSTNALIAVNNQTVEETNPNISNGSIANLSS